ncbi:hypothetical protein [Streptacidiphilus cavernicola]|uniref:Uncharacterized protein n=1 Tax=Streptacidiphilus cavernicola TaxID=3342716 RepID=A0ABV6VPP5_9ACTN
MADDVQVLTARLRARLAAGELPEAGPEIARLLDETERLTALLSGGTPEYAVRAVIDGQVGAVEDYGTDRELLLVRLEQPQPDGYRIAVLTRRTVRTPWTETTDPELLAALDRP